MKVPRRGREVTTAGAEAFKAPYLPFQTFWKFISFLAERPLPPRIDRSIMGGKSGTDQAGLFATLRAFELVDENNAVQDQLMNLAVKDEEERRVALAALIRKYYPQPMAISEQNGTELQLNEAFRDGFSLVAQDTRRKAVTFFLHAIREAGLPISANFPVTRAGSGGPGVPKTRTASKSVAGRNKAAPGPGQTPRTDQSPRRGDGYAVSLKSGGRVSIEVSVNLFDLSTEDRQFVIDLVDKLKGYGGGESPTE